MNGLPNLDQLAQRGRQDPDNLTAREAQVLNIRQDCEKATRGSMHQVDKDARMAAAVPPLLAHIDELYGEVENLRKYAETTKYHQDQHAAAVRELEKARFEVTQIAIDTSPAYAQLRDERDSARRERDEAMAKLATARLQGAKDELNQLIDDETNYRKGGAFNPTVLVTRVREIHAQLRGDQ